MVLTTKKYASPGVPFTLVYSRVWGKGIELGAPQVSAQRRGRRRRGPGRPHCGSPKCARSTGKRRKPARKDRWNGTVALHISLRSKDSSGALRKMMRSMEADRLMGGNRDWLYGSAGGVDAFTCSGMEHCRSRETLMAPWGTPFYLIWFWMHNPVVCEHLSDFQSHWPSFCTTPGLPTWDTPIPLSPSPRCSIS